MATASESKLMTAEEFMAADLGEGTFELVRGEVIEVPPPMPDHGRVASRTGFTLESFGRSTGFGYTLTESAVATERGPDTVRRPDVSFYNQARWPEHQVCAGLPPVPPDLAVEVVAPGSRRESHLTRAVEFFRAGVRIVWAIFPMSRQVIVYHDGGNDITGFRGRDIIEGFPELPGFRCDVADLFPPAPPQ